MLPMRRVIEFASFNRYFCRRWPKISGTSGAFQFFLLQK